MRLVEGVNLHLIPNRKFKNNHITLRFSGEFSQQTVARRVLVAQILASANASYPTNKEFRDKLASLYGTSLSTDVSTKGKVHIVDIDITCVKNSFTMDGEDLLEEVIDFLYTVLFLPLVSVEQYQSKMFTIKQKNLMNYLQADQDDSFYFSELELRKLYYNDPTLQLSKYGNKDGVAEENSYTAFQEFQKMLKEDCIDIFVLGEFDDYRMLQIFNRFPFEKRNKILDFEYQQDYCNITQEKIASKPLAQSVLQLAYHFPTRYRDEGYYALLLFNGMFGAFSHSKLFTEVREREGLAYTIGSQMDVFTGLLNVYAGIDSANRLKTLQVINKQFTDLKMGRFSSKLMAQTKGIIKSNITLASDLPKVYVERLYNKIFLKRDENLEEVIEKIDSVSKKDLLKVASDVKLQALYFLEAIEK